MSGTLALVVGIGIIIGAIYLLIKQYETRTVLLGAGFLMAILSFDPLIAFEAFSKTMVASAFIQAICSVLGFAVVMQLTEVDKHLINSMIKGLVKMRPVIIPCAAFATCMLNISIGSASGCAAAVGSILIPIMISMGVAPAVAASAVMLGTFGAMLNPGMAHIVVVANLAGMENMEVVKVVFLPLITAVTIGALSLTAIAIIRKENKGYVDPDHNITTDIDFKVNPFYAILPLIPIALLLALNTASVKAALPWSTKVNIPHVMLLGAFICMLATRTSPAQATSKFFDGMGKAYGDIIGIIISAGVFVAGMRAMGMIDAFLAVLQNSESIVNIAAAFGPFFLGVVSGSGDAAAIAFNESVTPHAEMFGVEIVDMGCMAALGGALGRTMSPIAGATIICASIAKVNPFEIAKRNGPGMFLAVIAAMILLLYI